MKRILILLLLLLISACTTDKVPAVTLTYPLNGTVIYAEAITLQGTLQNTTELAIHAELVERETGEVLTQITTTLGEAWTIELPLNYSGDPLQTTLRLQSEDQSTTYTTSDIIIADQSHRPDGSFGIILFPEDNSNIGGDSVQIDGTASGIRDNALTIQLLNSAGEVLASHPVTLINPFIMDEVPWQLSVELTDLRDLAQIRLISLDVNGDEILLDEVNVQIGEAAG